MGKRPARIDRQAEAGRSKVSIFSSIPMTAGAASGPVPAAPVTITKDLS